MSLNLTGNFYELTAIDAKGHAFRRAGRTVLIPIP